MTKPSWEQVKQVQRAMERCLGITHAIEDAIEEYDVELQNLAEAAGFSKRRALAAMLVELCVAHVHENDRAFFMEAFKHFAALGEDAWEGRHGNG